MSARVRELVERQAWLQQRCAAQRAGIAHEIATIENRFAGVDRVAGLAGKVLLHPLAIGGGLVAVLALGKTRGMRLVSRLFLLTSAARRLLQAARVLQGIVTPSSTAGTSR